MDDRKPIAVIAVALVAILAGGAWWMSRPKKTAQNATPAVVTATDAPIDKAGALPPVDLPPLDRMDGFLKPLLSALSSRPELARWLATDDLVRQLAMAIDQAAAGSSPARDFKVIAPTTPFVAAGRGLRRTIDPASYRRYDGLVLTVTSIDASSVAKIYKTIRPRLNEAYRSLGNQTSDVDKGLAQALDILVDTPVVKDPIEIVVSDKGGGWAYVDDDLETLRPSQKQLLRMGPANADRLLVWLRALQSALN
jgi:DUF3014 family protein